MDITLSYRFRAKTPTPQSAIKTTSVGLSIGIWNNFLDFRIACLECESRRFLIKLCRWKPNKMNWTNSCFTKNEHVYLFNNNFHGKKQWEEDATN